MANLLFRGSESRQEEEQGVQNVILSRMAIIGIIGESGSGTRELARQDQPIAGELLPRGTRRYLGPFDALDLSPVELLIIDHTLAYQDALQRAQASVALNRLRASGSTILLLSHEPALLRELWAPYLEDPITFTRR